MMFQSHIHQFQVALFHFFIQSLSTFRLFGMCMCSCSGSPPPTWAATALQFHWHSPHTPPGLVPPPPHLPQSTPSRFFMVSPVKTGMHSKIFDFLCTGPAPTPPTPPAHYAVTWGDYLRAFVHLCAPFHALSAPSVHLPHTLALLFVLHFPGLSPLSDFPLTLDPLLATMGNPALVQPGTAPIPDLCITKSNPCGPHVAHLPSLLACTTHIAIQGSGPARSPVAKVAPIFHCVNPCNRLANYSIPWPMGREILLSGQDSDLLSLGAYEGLALRGG